MDVMEIIFGIKVQGKEERKGAVLFIEFSKVGKPIFISYYTYRSLRGTYTIIYYITKKGNGN